MKGLIYKIGINDLPYQTQIINELPKVNGKRKRQCVWVCKYYSTWKDMLERCYSELFKQSRPTYRNVTCCEDWLYASRFKDWMEQQDWEGKQLDKDIIVPSNNMYSPEACAFVLPATNQFVVASDASRGEWPIGVSRWKVTGMFRSYCRNPFTRKEDHLGYFTTPEEAHEAWRKRKHELAQLVAATETDPRVVEALKKRYSYEGWYCAGR